MKSLLMILLTTFLNASLVDDFYIYQANKFYQKKEYQVAFEYLEKLENKSNEIFYNQGNILYLQGKYEEAISYYEKVKDLELRHQTNHNMANSYAKLQNYEKAIEFYSKALGYKKDEKTKFNLELIKLKKEEIDKINKRNLLKQTYSIKRVGTSVELHEDTIFDNINFDEDTPLYEDKVKKSKENKVSNTINSDQKMDIFIDDKNNKIDTENVKFELNSYFEQKWDKNIQVDSLKTLIVPLEKGVIGDSKKPW